jgi:hypothetical protein
MKFRVGRKVGRTLYLQLSDEPSDEDPLIGVMDTRALAALVCDAINARGLPPRGLLALDLLQRRTD